MNKIMESFLFVTLAVVFGCAIACDEESPPFEEFMFSEKYIISWPFPVNELEKGHMIEIRESGEMLPFGSANKFWLEFKSDIRENDKIYFFEFREPGFFMDGHFLVRQGCVVKMLRGRIS